MHNFNPHFRKGSDSPIERKGGDPCRFQSTLPQGKWPLPFLFCTGKSWFQSTLPQGKWRDWPKNHLVPLLFQSTLPQGKWPYTHLFSPLLINFNPHFRKGSDVCGLTEILVTGYFNPHFRKGSDFFCNFFTFTDQNFNPHFRKGSDWCSTGTNRPFGYFNPHFRKGSDSIHALPYQQMQISIHTSAREVTKWWRGFHYGTGISIHTSAREVTSSELNTVWSLGNFNPHFRKGSDDYHQYDYLALADFNPHFRKGSDVWERSDGKGNSYFNPHFRKGSDIIELRRSSDNLISIHTSAREVTDKGAVIKGQITISIHTSAREVTGKVGQ